MSKYHVQIRKIKLVTVKARRSDGVERDLVIRAAEEDSVRSLT